MQLKNEFDRLMLIFIIWNLGLAFSGSILFPAFAQMGFTVEQMLFLSTLTYLAPLIHLMLSRNYDSKISMPLGILFVALAYLSFIFIGGFTGAIALYTIGAISFFFFWVPFNTSWFSLKDKKNAGHSTLYGAIMVLLSLIIPALSGLIAQQFGFTSVFYTTILILIIAAIIAWKLAPQKKVSINFAKSLELLTGFRTLFFLEGFYQVAPVFLVTLITIQYFPKPADFGLFMSLATILSVLSSFLLSKISDQSGKRREFILISAIGMGVSTIFAASVSNLFWWFVAVSLVNFFRVIFFPFPLALMLDRKNNMPQIMYAREIFLNLGRSAGAVLSLIIYLATGNLTIPLIITGLSMFVYAGIFEFMKLKKIKNR